LLQAADCLQKRIVQNSKEILPLADAIFLDIRQRHGPVGRVLDLISRFFAICAGIVLTLMALMSLASILGRTFFDKPILGDFELVQIMSAIAVSMTLPFCQMIRGHIIVDFFTTAMPKRVNLVLDVIASLLLALAGFIMSWHIAGGMIDLRQTGDASMLLNIPLWYAYVPMVPSFLLLGCAALYTAWNDLQGEKA
jgi:TRAP-type C4-dicarboxylate transport system permease small subunit